MAAPARVRGKLLGRGQFYFTCRGMLCQFSPPAGRYVLSLCGQRNGGKKTAKGEGVSISPFPPRILPLAKYAALALQAPTADDCTRGGHSPLAPPPKGYALRAVCMADAGPCGPPLDSPAAWRSNRPEATVLEAQAAFFEKWAACGGPGVQGARHKNVGTARRAVTAFFRAGTPLAAFFSPFLCPHKEMGPPEAFASLAQREVARSVSDGSKGSLPLKAPLCKGGCLGAKRRDWGIAPQQENRRKAQQSGFPADKEEGGSGYGVFGLRPETEWSALLLTRVQG